MKNFLKGKAATAIILIFTLILAGVAIFTAIRLYQLRQQPVAPNVPSSFPHAQEVTPTPSPATCSLSFAILAASPTPTPTGSPSPTPTGSSTPTPTGTASPTPTPTSSVTPGPTGTPAPPSLPQSGYDWPTIVGATVGIITILGSLLLAL